MFAGTCHVNDAEGTIIAHGLCCGDEPDERLWWRISLTVEQAHALLIGVEGLRDGRIFSAVTVTGRGRVVEHAGARLPLVGLSATRHTTGFELVGHDGTSPDHLLAVGVPDSICQALLWSTGRAAAASAQNAPPATSAAPATGNLAASATGEPEAART